MKKSLLMPLVIGLSAISVATTALSTVFACNLIGMIAKQVKEKD